MPNRRAKSAAWPATRNAAPLLLLLVACAAIPAPALAQFGPTPVIVCPVVEQEMPPSIRLVGNVLADRSAVVATEVAGVVAEVLAHEGQQVHAGDVLVRLDPMPAQFRVAEARAELQTRAAYLAELEAGTRKEEIRRQQAASDEAQAMYDKWLHEKRRVTELSARDQSNPKELHDTEMEYLAAERRLMQEKARLEIALNGPRQEEIARAKFAVAAQQAVLQRLERELARTEIRAPFDGAIVVRQAELGEWLSEGGAVCEMVAIDSVKIRVDVPERVIRFATIGASCSMEIEALRQTRIGEIRRVIPRAADVARSFPVEIDLKNTDRALLPGMFVTAYLPAGPSGKRTLVSKDAIVARGTSKQVFVIRPGEKGAAMALPVSVETGLERLGLVEIIAPEIKAGDQVVCRGNERLFAPTPVIPQPASDASTSQPASQPDSSARTQGVRRAAPDASRS